MNDSSMTTEAEEAVDFISDETLERAADPQMPEGGTWKTEAVGFCGCPGQA